MKNLLLISALFLSFWVNAQSNIQGIITYEETLQLKIDLPEGTDHELIRSKLPTSRTYKKELTFNSGESIYKSAAQDKQTQELETEDESQGIKIKMQFTGDNNQLYQNTKENQLIEQLEFMGRQFRIKEDLNSMKWKLTNEKKEILNYSCIKAILEDTSRKVEAWFTMQIPASLGPATYRGLPGLILAVNINDGQSIVQAKSIKIQEVDEASITVPSKGKEVSREEFTKIRDKKLKEMQEMYGGKGSFIIQKN